jgi:hypothetical protein
MIAGMDQIAKLVSFSPAVVTCTLALLVLLEPSLLLSTSDIFML